MFGNSGGENLDQMAKVNIAEWSLRQRKNSVTRLRLAKRLRGLHLCMNSRSERVKVRQITVSELVDHYRQRELKPDSLWKSDSTKVTYDGYLNEWIMPRWGNYTLNRISAGEVELWLRSLALAKSSCAKIRNVMSVLFNHGIRHEICKYNPIRLVRQGAKRKKFPVVLSASEIRRLIAGLALRERTLVLLEAGTGLRMSELFAPKWRDINFQSKEISITRSIVLQVVGPCKTEASQKPIPLDAYLAEVLRIWREQTPYQNQMIGYLRVPPRPAKTVLGTNSHEEFYPSCHGEDRHRTNRMAYVPAHLLAPPTGNKNGYQGNARLASSCFQPSHIGYLHASGHNPQTESSK
jgi:integrase